MSTAPHAPSSSTRQLVLLGASNAHLNVLRVLAAHPLAGIQITLLAPQTPQVHPAMGPGFVAGHYPLDHCTIDLQPLVRRAGIRWITQAVRTLDAHNQTLELDDGSHLRFDWLSVNTRAIHNRDAMERDIPGCRTHGLFVRPIESFVALWPQVAAMGDSRALRVAVIGGGATGIELALAVRHRLPQSAITLLCGPQGPGVNFPLSAQVRLQHYLKHQRITVLKDVATGIAADAVQLGCGAALACDVPILATPAQPPTWLAASGLALDPLGFLAVDNYQRSTSHSRVFAAGDVSTRMDMDAPRSGLYALRGGPILAHNLVAAIGGQALRAHAPPAKGVRILSGAGRYAIASWGTFSAQGRWVWWLKNGLDRRFIANATRA